MGRRWVGKKAKIVEEAVPAAKKASKAAAPPAKTATKVASPQKNSTAHEAKEEQSARPPVYSRALLLEALSTLPADADAEEHSGQPAALRAQRLGGLEALHSAVEEDGSTQTMLLTNVPSSYTRDVLTSHLEKQGCFADMYDLLYLPIDSSTGENLGYFLIDFVSREQCNKFVSKFHGRPVASCFPGSHTDLSDTGQLCEVRPAPVQGLRANLERVRSHPCFGMTAYAKAAGYDNVAARHLAAEAAAHAAARARAASAAHKAEGSCEEKVRKQIEFYFSARNLSKDQYLRSRMDEDGWVTLQDLLAFPRLHSLGASRDVASASLNGSPCLELSADMQRVRLSNAILRQLFPQMPPPKEDSPTGDASDRKVASPVLPAAVPQDCAREVLPPQRVQLQLALAR